MQADGFSGILDPTEYYERRRADEVEAARVAYSAVTDPAVVAVLDVLAPVHEGTGQRMAIFDWGGEVNPAPQELVDLAVEVVSAVRAAESAH